MQQKEGSEKEIWEHTCGLWMPATTTFYRHGSGQGRWVLLRVLLRVLFLWVICLSVFGPFFCFIFFFQKNKKKLQSWTSMCFLKIFFYFLIFHNNIYFPFFAWKNNFKLGETQSCLPSRVFRIRIQITVSVSEKFDHLCQLPLLANISQHETLTLLPGDNNRGTNWTKLLIS